MNHLEVVFMGYADLNLLIFVDLSCLQIPHFAAHGFIYDTVLPQDEKISCF